MKKTRMEKYFTQKRWTVLEIISAILSALAVIYIFKIRYVYFGLPFLAVPLAVLFFSKSCKAEDYEVDILIDKFKREAFSSHDFRKCISTFDYSANPLVRGSDGILRSPSYVITFFEERKSTAMLTVYRLDLLKENVTCEKYKIGPDSPALLEEREIIVPMGKKKLALLKLPSYETAIPVITDDIYSAEKVYGVCNKCKAQ